MHRKKLIITFILLTIVNVLIFIFRDAFTYRSYSTYQSLYAACDKDCSKKWDQFIYDFPEVELKEAKRISDSFLINSPRSTKEKILQTGSFIYNRFKKQMGAPSANLLSLSPLNQYKNLCSSDIIKLWCGNFAEMFCFFCWSQNIVCRTIEIINPGDHHVLNECYLPETNKWMMVDVTNNLLSAEVTGTKSVLNLLDFKKTLKDSFSIQAWHASDSGLQIAQVDPGAPFIKNYYKKTFLLFYYYQVDNNKVYTTGNKIKRYFLPVSWYDIFDSKTENNLLFYVKEVFILLWIISFFVFIISVTKFRI